MLISSDHKDKVNSPITESSTIAVDNPFVPYIKDLM
jgi:hypothetical protein